LRRHIIQTPVLTYHLKVECGVANAPIHFIVIMVVILASCS
jgi:hypothetical protein